MNNPPAFYFRFINKAYGMSSIFVPWTLARYRKHFFFQALLCNKAENYSLFKVNSYEFLSSNVLIHFFFFLILMVRYVVESFDPRPRFVSSCGSLLLATVSTLALFILFLFIFIVSSGNIFF